MDKWLPSIVSLIIALIGFGGSLLLVKGQRRKLEAESAQLIVNAAGGLVDDLNTEIQRLRSEIVVLREELTKTTERLSKLQVSLTRSEAERQRLEKQVAKLEAELKIGLVATNQRIQELTKGIAILTEQIRQQGLVPAWVDK